MISQVRRDKKIQKSSVQPSGIRARTLLQVLVLTLIHLRCATPAQVTLLSEPPQAEIFLTASGDQKPQRVGLTPLTLQAAQLSKLHGGSGPVSIEFKKEGYSPQKAFITDLGIRDLTLQFQLDPLSGLEDLDRLNRVVDQLFESQRLVRVGRQEEALVSLKAAEKELPHLAASYELEGGIYYLQKKYREALDAYSLASSYHPKNPQTLQMKNYLEKSLGVQRTSIPEVGAP
jgi:tetratricopeptide (TPR) repeat protein